MEKIKQGDSMNREQFINGNREKIIEIINNLNEIKVLSIMEQDEEVDMHLKLIEFGLVTMEGNITQEGILCLYH